MYFFLGPARATVLRDARPCVLAAKRGRSCPHSSARPAVRSEKAVRAIGAALMPFAFDRVYSHHFERVIDAGAKQALQSSVERYVAAIGGAYDRA